MRIIAVFIAIVSALLVLLGYFVPALAGMETILLNWAMILAGAAMFLGIFNLISVHGEKIRRREKGSIYSVLLLFALLGTFFLTFVLGPNHISMQILMGGIILPAEAMLMGLLTITLLYAAIRLLRRRANVMSFVFLAIAALVLLGTATLPFGNMPLFNSLRSWLTQAWAVGGARGILIGVALGTLTTGLRVLIGADRPYGGK
jgi:hypothetical protein